MAKSVDIGSASSFSEGTIRQVQIQNRSLVVICHDGHITVLRDRCPHQGANLSKGKAVEMACAYVKNGEIIFSGSEVVLQCPWHGWAFRLENGRSLSAPGISVRHYPTRVVNDRLLVDLE